MAQVEGTRIDYDASDDIEVYITYHSFPQRH